MTDRRRRRAGFTLIELLVVIAIIAVLISLLLPAVQSVREAARRAQCINNMMQLSLAVKNYEASHEMLPPSVVNPGGPIKNQPKGYHISWVVQLLPYLEQRAIFDHIDFEMTGGGAYGANNVTARSMVIRTLLCPSDPLGGGTLGSSSYAGCHHDVEAPIDVDNHGVFFLNSNVRLEDIPDGSSNTIFFGEKKNYNDLGWISGTRSTLRNTGTRLNAAAIPTIKNNDPVGGFGSNHPGGANFAFGDGSVRFVKISIAPTVFERLGNRADGEMISGAEF